MPLYRYVCDTCQTDSEELESMEAPSEQPCFGEDCHGTRKRRIGTGSFHLKGGGWHADGYANSSKD